MGRIEGSHPTCMGTIGYELPEVVGAKWVVSATRSEDEWYAVR
jgi:hypothetical protein